MRGTIGAGRRPCLRSCSWPAEPRRLSRSRGRPSFYREASGTSKAGRQRPAGGNVRSVSETQVLGALGFPTHHSRSGEGVVQSVWSGLSGRKEQHCWFKALKLLARLHSSCRHDFPAIGCIRRSPASTAWL